MTQKLSCIDEKTRKNVNVLKNLNLILIENNFFFCNHDNNNIVIIFSFYLYLFFQAAWPMQMTQYNKNLM